MNLTTLYPVPSLVSLIQNQMDAEGGSQEEFILYQEEVDSSTCMRLLCLCGYCLARFLNIVVCGRYIKYCSNIVSPTVIPRLLTQRWPVAIVQPH